MHPASVHILVESITDCVILMLGSDGQIASWNPGAEQLFGLPAGDAVGQPFSQLVLRSATSGPEERVLQTAARDGRDEVETWLVGRGGAPFWAHLVLTAIPGEEGRLLGVACAVRDITQARSGARRQAAHHAVTGILAEASLVADAIPRILRVIAENLDWEVGLFWSVEPNAAALRCVEVCDLPPGSAPEFEALSRQLTLGKGVGLPGRVWAQAQPLWVANVLTDADFTRPAAAARAGLHAALAFPVQLEGEPLGVVEFLSREVREPDGEILALMATVGSQLGQFMKRRQAEQELRDSEERYRSLSRRLLEVQEAERRHIARELHDEVGQALTGLKITLHAVHQGTSDASAALLLREAASQVDRIMQQLRTLSLELHPPMMDDLGLAAALRWYVKGLAERTGLAVELDMDALAGRFPAELEMACFRVVQEALTNVIKHARARTARVDLRHGAGALHLTLRDDGVGFDVAAARKHSALGASLGLLGMEERGRLRGGQLGMESAPGAGTEIRARFPLDSTATTPPQRGET